MARLVVPADELGEGPGFSYLWEGKPFTGVAVDFRDDGSVESLTEISDGRHHGYGVDFDTKGNPRYVVQYHYHRVHGLQGEWDEQGRLLSAERFEEGFLTQELEINPETGEAKVIDRPENTEEIKEARSHLKVQSPPMARGIQELLSDLEKRVPALLEEAKQGIGMI